MAGEMKKPKDHAERLEAARALAGWHLGYRSWADMLINEYLNDPDEADARLKREKAN